MSLFRSRSFALFSVAVLSVALFAAGCGSGPTGEVTGPKVSTFDGATPAEAAKKINLVPGSVIEMRQTFLGFGAKLSAALAGQNKEGTRIITVSRFAPLNRADIEWKLSSKVEADSSIKAREEARKQKNAEPDPVMVDQVSTGAVQGFNLSDAHSLYLPAFWPAENHESSSFQSSGIWLSRDVYEGLARNRVATLDFGLLDAALQGAVAKAADLAKPFAALQSDVDKVGNRVDVRKLDGEADVSEWTLRVNGRDVKVEVLKARNWFGEVVVLNNPQNPLVLKVTLNPLTVAGTLDKLSDISALPALVGYEVTELKDVQE